MYYNHVYRQTPESGHLFPETCIRIPISRNHNNQVVTEPEMAQLVLARALCNSQSPACSGSQICSCSKNMLVLEILVRARPTCLCSAYMCISIYIYVYLYIYIYTYIYIYLYIYLFVFIHLYV